MKIFVTDIMVMQLDKQKKINTVHIDTSLQVERFKTQKKAQLVEDVLKAFGFKSTSSYSKLEFKRVWLRRLAYLYTATEKITRTDELFDYITDRFGSHPGHRRALCTCLQAITSFLSRINGALSSDAQLIRLRIHIRNAILGAYDLWESSVTYEYNGTECIRAFEQPRSLAGGKIEVSIPQCVRGKIQCGIHIFFEENKKVFSQIRTAIENLGDGVSNELKKTAQIISNAEKDSKCLCDNRICSLIGDSLIAIDGIDMDYFAANNDKEWQLLSKVLGKELINPIRKLTR